jgi:hypothetical protein
VVFAHFVLAFCSTLIYLNQVDLSAFSYWRSRSALGVVFIALPPIIPYAVSVIHAWQVVTARQLGLYLFLVVLLGGTVVNALLLLGVFNVRVDGSTVFWAVIIQSIVYFWSGEMLLTIERS